MIDAGRFVRSRRIYPQSGVSRQEERLLGARRIVDWLAKQSCVKLDCSRGIPHLNRHVMHSDRLESASCFGYFSGEASFNNAQE